MDFRGFSAFIDAIRNGDFQRVQQEFLPTFLTRSDESGCLPVHIASQHNDLEVLKFLLKQNCNIESKDKNGWRPIHFAVSEKILNNIKTLVGLGCELSKTDQILQDLLNRPDCDDLKQIITTAMGNYQIGIEMGLTCSIECDHHFCLKSISFNEFEEGQFVNRGKFGKISKVSQSEGGRIFAIKKVDWNQYPSDVIEEVRKEALIVENNINIYRLNLVHERITKYYGAIVKGYKMFIFMDFYQGGSIYELLNKFTSGLPDDRLLKYSQQILEGLSFLHENNIIHRDLKTANILLDINDNCKLTDFGCSRFLESLTKNSQKHLKPSNRKKKKDLPKSKCGTTNYMAPEMIKGATYDCTSDIWSAAATVYEMFTGSPLFAGLKANVVMLKIAGGELPDYKKIKENPHNKIISLLDSMFIIEPSLRPSAAQLLNTHFKS